MNPFSTIPRPYRRAEPWDATPSAADNAHAPQHRGAEPNKGGKIPPNLQNAAPQALGLNLKRKIQTLMLPPVPAGLNPAEIPAEDLHRTPLQPAWS